MGRNLYARNKETLNSATYDLLIDVDEIPANIDYSDVSDLKKQIQDSFSLAKNINVNLSNAVIDRKENLLINSSISMRVGKLNDFIPVPTGESGGSYTPKLDYNVYYVSTEGNDNNDGLTRETAFKTLKKAVATVKDDDVIILLNGVHKISETIEFDTSCSIQGESATETVIDLNDSVSLDLAELQIPAKEDVNITISLFNLTLLADKIYKYSKAHHYVNQGDTVMKIGKGELL